MHSSSVILPAIGLYCWTLLSPAVKYDYVITDVLIPEMCRVKIAVMNWTSAGIQDALNASGTVCGQRVTDSTTKNNTTLLLFYNKRKLRVIRKRTRSANKEDEKVTLKKREVYVFQRLHWMGDEDRIVKWNLMKNCKIEEECTPLIWRELLIFMESRVISE